MSTILITGAGSGFGKGVALGLAKAGHTVIAAAEIWPQVWQLRREAEAEALALEVIKLDVTDEIDRAHALRYDIDVLVNNAGVMITGPVTEVPDRLWRAAFDVNVFGNLALTRGFVPKLLAKGAGRIVWTSSVGGIAKLPFFGPYIATKHAIEAIAGIMRLELEPYGVTVQTVNPAAYRTGFNDTGVESMHQWYDPETAAIKPIDLSDGLDQQGDPQQMIEAMIAVAAGHSHHYRTMLPADAVTAAQQEQADEWTRTV